MLLILLILVSIGQALHYEQNHMKDYSDIQYDEGSTTDQMEFAELLWKGIIKMPDN